MPDTSEATAPQPTQWTFTYGKKPVRCRMIQNEPWFAADDLYAVAGLEAPADPFETWDEQHHELQLFDTDERGTGPLMAVTLTGALTIAADAKYPAHNILSAWLRNRIGELRTPEGEELQRPPLTLLADGTMPPRPKMSSAAYNEWHKLSLNLPPALVATGKWRPAWRSGPLGRYGR